LVKPLLAQTVAPPAWLHWLVSVQAAPIARLEPPEVVPPQTPLVQSSAPQQPVPSVQVPPWFRQQLSGPSPVKPLLAQTVAPPAWLHWLVEVQTDPGGNDPPPGDAGSAQTPPMQCNPAQQPAQSVHAPPS
jgi:hypothetical protein